MIYGQTHLVCHCVLNGTVHVSPMEANHESEDVLSFSKAVTSSQVYPCTPETLPVSLPCGGPLLGVLGGLLDSALVSVALVKPSLCR